MTRYEQAVAYHKKGFNCNQSLLASFADITGMTEQECFDLGAGFGAGAFTGELCGALTGGIMVLGKATPVDPADPVGSKRRTGALGKEFQARFEAKYGSLRCTPLLKTEIKPETSAAAMEVGTTNRCEILILAAMEIVEELLAERQAANG